jgi:hypothetical protein
MRGQNVLRSLSLKGDTTNSVRTLDFPPKMRGAMAQYRGGQRENDGRLKIGELKNADSIQQNARGNI